jgi:hypothetical protein
MSDPLCQGETKSALVTMGQNEDEENEDKNLNLNIEVQSYFPKS